MSSRIRSHRISRQPPLDRRRRALLAGAAGLAFASRASAQPVPRVAVVGAGMAGIAAARALAEAGLPCVVFEARDRIGGRMHTDRTLGVPVELGAGWIQGIDGNPLTRLARDAGLRTIASDYERGRRYGADGSLLRTSERDALDALEEDLGDAIAAAQEEAGERQPLSAAIDRYADAQGLDDDERRALDYVVTSSIEHEYADDASRLSLGWFDSVGGYGGGDVIVAEGYGALVASLARGLDIRTGMRVDAIAHDAGGVRLDVAGRRHAFDAAIVSVPLGVLQHGGPAFDPPLPRAQQAAIGRLGVGVLDRLCLQFDTVFWPRDAHWLGHVAQRRGEWCEWFNLAAMHGAPVLVGFNAGDVARRFGRLDERAVVESALATLRTLFGQDVPAPTALLRTRWHEDPHARGSYSAIAPGSTPEDYVALAQPCGPRLVLAGEHTHRRHCATVPGAYLSGRRAAEQIAGMLA